MTKIEIRLRLNKKLIYSIIKEVSKKMSSDNVAFGIHSYSKLMRNYYKHLHYHWKKEKTNQDIIYSRKSDYFVQEQDIYYLKNFYLKAPIKNILGQEFCNLLWDYMKLYEEIKDEYCTKYAFIYLNYFETYKDNDEYRKLYEEILTKLYTSPEYCRIIDIMRRDSPTYLSRFSRKEGICYWKYYDNYTINTDIPYRRYNDIIMYTMSHNIINICECYTKYMINKIKKLNNINKKRELFNTIMNKNGVTCDDTMYNKYLEWTKVNGIKYNRYKKMVMFANENKSIYNSFKQNIMSFFK